MSKEVPGDNYDPRPTLVLASDEERVLWRETAARRGVLEADEAVLAYRIRRGNR